MIVSLGLLFGAFALAYRLGYPPTVGQRVAMWLDPWANALPGGNQIAQGYWALASGALWGTGGGLGDPQLVPAAHTDFVLTAIGEELGWVGLAAIVALYALLIWRCLRAALRAPGRLYGDPRDRRRAQFDRSGDHHRERPAGPVAAVRSRDAVSELWAFVDAGQLRRGRYRTRHLAARRTATAARDCPVANDLARAGGRRHRPRRPGRVDSGCSCPTLSPSVAGLAEQADGGLRFEYNPRLVDAARVITRGTIYDRNGLPLATSRATRWAAARTYTARRTCATPHRVRRSEPRCYPLGSVGVSCDWRIHARRPIGRHEIPRTSSVTPTSSSRDSTIARPSWWCETAAPEATERIVKRKLRRAAPAAEKPASAWRAGCESDPRSASRRHDLDRCPAPGARGGCRDSQSCRSRQAHAWGSRRDGCRVGRSARIGQLSLARRRGPRRASGPPGCPRTARSSALRALSAGSTFKLVVAAAALRAAPSAQANRSCASGCPTDGSETMCAARRGRSETTRWTTCRTGPLICGAAWSCRATRTSRSSRCAWARGG